jgi:putative N6-adenine-specific DNA methylase
MDIFSQPIIVKTFQGFESILAAEMNALGAQEVEQHTRAVSCAADPDPAFLYRLNLELRSAIRVLVRIHTGKANDYEDLYRITTDYAWEKLIRAGNTFAIDAQCYSDVFTHSHYTALKLKDAIVDRIRKQTSRRPNVNTDSPDYRINILVRGLDFEIYIDSSAEPLFKRGYRSDHGPAPLNEVMAAGLVLLSGWPSSGLPLWDPMCGSGTILTEAAMIQSKQAPGLLREQFGFMRWKPFDAHLWEKMLKEAEERIEDPGQNMICASDVDNRAVQAAKSNALAAGVRRHIRFKKADFFTCALPFEAGIIITNPPYDKRMEVDDAVDFYQRIGDRLKNDLSGWQAWIFSGQEEGMKHLGLKPSARHHLMNGAIECKYNKYELFKGKRKEFLAQ